MEGSDSAGLDRGIRPPSRCALGGNEAGARGCGDRKLTIWNVGDELFGYYECEKGIEYAARVQRESPIVEKWNEYMKDILIMELDPVTGAQPKLTKVFSFK